MNSVKFGIIGFAKIARERVIPAIQNGQNCEVYAIASRKKSKALLDYATKHGISHVYDNYEELLQDKQVTAVYNPLPNHIHVDWSIKAMQFGKHVLCEKPFGLHEEDIKNIIKQIKKYPSLKVMEAFMYRFHPQWTKVVALIEEGKIGEVKHVETVFSYYNTDPNNIRNKKDYGGGALYDIGCYGVSVARFILKENPKKVKGLFNVDKIFNTDTVCTASLEFQNATASISCATKMFPYQNVKIFGTKGYINVEVPFNPKSIARIILVHDDLEEIIMFESCDQYTLQAEVFSNAIINDIEVPITLNDTMDNMRVIDEIYSKLD